MEKMTLFRKKLTIKNKQSNPQNMPIWEYIQSSSIILS